MSEPSCFPTVKIPERHKKYFSDTKMVLESIQKKTFYIDNETEELSSLSNLIPGHDKGIWKDWNQVYTHLCDEIGKHKCFKELFDAYTVYESTKEYPQFFFKVNIATFEELNEGVKTGEYDYLKWSVIKTKINSKKLYTFNYMGNFNEPNDQNTQTFHKLVKDIVHMRMFLYREDAGLKPYKENTSDEKIDEIYSSLCERYTGYDNNTITSKTKKLENDINKKKKEMAIIKEKIAELTKTNHYTWKNSKTGESDTTDLRNPYEKTKQTKVYSDDVIAIKTQLTNKLKILKHAIDGMESQLSVNKRKLNNGFEGGKRSRKSKKRSRKSKKRTRKNKKSKRKSK